MNMSGNIDYKVTMGLIKKIPQNRIGENQKFLQLVWFWCFTLTKSNVRRVLPLTQHIGQPEKSLTCHTSLVQWKQLSETEAHNENGLFVYFYPEVLKIPPLDCTLSHLTPLASRSV